MATSKKKTSVEATEILDDVIVAPEEEEKLDLKKVTPGTVRIDDNAVVNVKSNVFGELVYVDGRSREETRWDRCGSVQQMSFGSLRSMKASAISFFKNQWVIMTGFADENAEKYTAADIYKALFVTQYYKDLIEPSDYESVCSWSPAEIKQKVSLMSAESKANLVVALNIYIKKGILDSLKRIKTFEEVLGCELEMPE